MGTVIRRAGAVLALALLVVASPLDARAAETSYDASAFTEGPMGGDRYNHVERGEDGRITVARLYPVPGPIGCSAAAGYAKYLVAHTADAPVSAVSVAFTEAAVDPYVILSAVVRDQAGRAIGYTSTRGAVGDGTLEVDVTPVADEVLSAITVEFGVEVSSACPSVDAGTLRFTSVTVEEA